MSSKEIKGIGGTRPPPGTTPWAGAVLKRSDSIQGFDFAGSCVILSNSTVLSACHLLSPETETPDGDERFYLWNADSYPKKFDEAWPTLSIAKRFRMETDVDLVEFECEQEFQADLSCTLSILADKEIDQLVTVGAHLGFVGWGAAGKAQSTTPGYKTLLDVTVSDELPSEVVTHCNKFYGKNWHERYLFTRDLGRGIAEGDSGGGLFIEVDGIKYLVGIASARKLMADNRTICGIYSRISDRYVSVG